MRTLTRLCLAVSVGSSALVAQQSFDFPRLLVQFPEEADDVELVADLDGDSDLDLIAFGTLGTSAVKTHFSVRLRNAHGLWLPSAPVVLPPETGRSHALGDVDLDGLHDLVLTAWTGHPSGPGLVILPGLPGGAFGAALHVPLAGDPTDVRVGNANGDGVPDLLVRHHDGAAFRVRWVLGDPARQFPLGPTALAAPTVYAVAIDVDDDGLDDVAALDDAGTAITVLRTLPAGLVPHVAWPLPGGAARGLIRVDWENDGRVDLFAALGQGTGELPVRLHHQAGWTIAPPQFAWDGQAGAAYFPVDWDGDGVTDIAVRRREAPGGMFHVNGVSRNYGAFLSNPIQPMTVRVVDGSPTTGAGIADVNGDGHADFVDSKAIQLGSGSFGEGWQASNTSGASEDWDGDGDVDRGITSRNDGRGQFVQQTLTSYPPSTSGVFTELLAATDLEGDGLHEWLYRRIQQNGYTLTFLDVRLWRETPNVGIVDAGSPVAPGVQLGKGIFVDTDADGDRDYVDGLGVWANDGTSFFSAAGAGIPGQRLAATADFDDDGDEDIVAHGAGSSSVFLRTAPNTFAPVPLAGSFTCMHGAKPIVADLDGDGDVDLAQVEVQSSQQFHLRVYENVSGVLTLLHTWPVLSEGRVTCVDLNGDGMLDLATITGSLDLWHRVGPGLAYTPRTRVVAEPGVGVSDFADLDQDGDIDLCGPITHWNRRFDGDDAGYRRQYGTGGAGSGQFRPLLSVTGPVRGGLVPGIRLRYGLGGSVAVLIVGNGQTAVPSVVLPGVTAYVSQPQLLLGYGLTGALGQPGAGGLDLPVAVPPGIGGTRLFLQAIVFDPATPSAFAFSNGCEMFVGN